MRRVRSLVCLLAVTCLIAGCSASKSDDDGLPAAGISANFAASPQWGSAPLTVQFTDTSTSTQGIATWLWDFGDGQTSAERHPMHGYTAEGSYDVSLTVTGPEGSDTEIKAGFITVNAPAGDIAAGFTATPTSGAKPLDVQFTDISTSTSGITTWSWDFGDGATSSVESPSHEYVNEGNYTVSLTVTSPDGSDTETKADFIQVAATGEITADFFASPPGGPVPLSVQFTDTSMSTSGISTWLWDFGDGGTGSTQFPLHVYNSAGSFDVNLTVTGPDGSDTESKAGFITTYQSAPKAPELDISVWVQGGPYTIAGLAGKVVLLDFASPST